MTFASRTQFHIGRSWGQCLFSIELNSVLNVKAVVAAFNQEKALVGAFSVIANLRFGWTFVASSRDKRSVTQMMTNDGAAAANERGHES